MNTAEKRELIEPLKKELKRYEQKIDQGFKMYSRLRDYKKEEIDKLYREISNSRDTAVDPSSN